MAETPYSHPVDQHFEFLAPYLRHLVDTHGIEETPHLWRQGRTQFDWLHAEAHGIPESARPGHPPIAPQSDELRADG